MVSSSQPVSAVRTGTLQNEWPAPRTPKEWERDFPGALDSLGVLFGAANIIMQLSLRPVGYGVVESPVESGALFKNPVKRARTTFTYLTVALLGTTEEKLKYRGEVNKSHAQIRSTEKSPVQYNAFDPELQLWVAACLYWGTVYTLNTFHEPLSREKSEALYKALQPLGTTLQVRQDMWPATLDDFEAYWERGLAKAQIDDTLRGYFNAIVNLKFLHPALRFLFAPMHRLVTAGALPPALRQQMHYEWTADDQRRFDRVIGIFRTVNNLLPRAVRQLPTVLVMHGFRRRLKQGRRLV